MKNILSDKEIITLSSIVNIFPDILIFLSKQNLLNHYQAREILIKDEYKALVNESNQSKGKLMESLAKKYKVSVSSIEIAIYNKSKNKNYKKKKHE